MAISPALLHSTCSALNGLVFGTIVWVYDRSYPRASNTQASNIVLFRLNPSTKLSDRDCVNGLWPAAAEGTSDAVIGIEPENDPPGACAVGKVEEVVVGEGGKLGEGEEECFVDELQGLGIEDVKKNKKQNGEEEEKKPNLGEGYV
ncbi:hypothetical protein PIB30_040359 [Stylosanthes scabra]|uniref:Uncharacterized protein n=1 Tax=Stylosanthes scabra TaxID=79078 RepID=A0ABU6WGQ8_9FABA|nr:hypothetical protein [Stylosanthes scabra]